MAKCKRALSLLLVMLMMLSLLPISAFADDEQSTYSIVINYVFQDNTQAAPSWTATVAAGSAIDRTVPSPTVVGYTPDPEAVPLNYTNIQTDITVKVTYSPAPVNFTVRHYQQNVDNDNYTLTDTETDKTGLTASAVGDALAKSYPGFTALLYDTTTKIAADGSTVVEIYYDRNYYLLNLDLDGGFGAEPVYARYGAPISVANPTKPGYTFGGWSETEDGAKVTLPSTMPAENMKLKALWTPMYAVNYTVVFWYENADDTEYSYAGSLTRSAAAGTSVNSGTFQNTSFTGCDADHFTYNSAKAETVTVAGDGSTVLNVYYTRNTYTLTFKDGNIKIVCGKVEHKHSFATCCDKLHKNSCNGYGLGKRCNTNNCPVGYEHEHTTGGLFSSSCYKTSDLTITAKYQADIHGNFPIKDGDKTIWWTVPSNCESFEPGNYLGSIDIMPGENITFALHGKESGAKIYYYVETLNGASSATNYNGKNYNLYKEIDLDYNTDTNLTYKEEFHPIKGFTQGDSNPVLPTDGSVQMQKNNYLYYTRNSYTLSFYNYNAEVTNRQTSVQYEAPLGGYDFTPDYPASLETNAYEFAGWYLNPECTGEEYKLDEHTMPANNLMLYAKWVPVNHTVRTFLTEDAVGGTAEDTFTVQHGAPVKNPPENPTNGSYVFVGWFYKENGVEKAFDFSMAITRDMDLYARWSSNKLVSYTVKYQLEDNGTRIPIAADTTGSALAGTTKTFNAKTGNDLYDGYREGYFPTTVSHSLTLDIEGGNEYIFVYVQKNAVPYTVKYVDAVTGAKLIPAKTVEDNRSAIVTEKYEVISGYMPDAVYKRLVVTADGTNEIIFYYTEDTQHAPVTINHWTQTPDGSTYEQYSSITFAGNIGDLYSESAKEIKNYIYVENPAHPLTDHPASASGILTAAGLELNLYYDLKCFYVVHVQSGEQPKRNIILLDDNTTYSLTDAVTPGYLYGGAFADETCQTVYPFNGQTGLSFTPERGETYYIREVPTHYLIPKTTAVWRYVNGQQTVTQLYLMTPIDRLLYREVGFIKDGETHVSKKDGENVAYGQIDVTKFGKLSQIIYVNGSGAIMIDSTGPAASGNYEGYIGLYQLTQDEFNTFTENNFTFQPYWVTLDGVKVTSTIKRTCGYSKPEATGINIVEEKTVDSVRTAAVTPGTQSLTFVAAYSYDADPNGIDPVDPVEPIDPVEPPGEDGIVITVHDNDHVYEVAAKPGDNLTGQLLYAGAAGTRFAGWFTDECCTVPADFSCVRESMTVYARYVSDAFLRFKYVQQRWFGSEVYLFTAIDADAYAEVGFLINGEVMPADYIGSQYSLYSARMLFGGDVGRNARLVLGSFSADSLSRGDSVTITPYWITPDGTMVCGENRTLTRGWFGLEG